MQQWFLATRPWSLTASVIPVSMGAVLALSMGDFQPWLFLLTLLGAVFLQLATNLLNTYGDFISGVDTVESARTCPQLVTGQFRPEQMQRAGLVALVFAVVVGLVLVIHSGWLLLAFGVAGVLGAYGYTTGRIPYKYLGLGPIMVFWLMGPLLTVPAWYVQTGTISWAAMWIGLPIGLLVTAILHANELRDISHDRAAGIRTLSLWTGLRVGLILYLFVVAGAYLSLLLLTLTGIIPTGALLAVLLVPVSVRYLRPFWRFVTQSNLSSEEIADVMERVRLLEGFSAESHFKFGLLMLAGLLVETGVRTL